MNTSHAVLFEEHCFLGAQFETDEAGYEHVASYPFASQAEFSSGHAFLMDMDGYEFSYVHGPAATSFISCASASPLPAISQLAPAALLSGTGSLLSLPFIARTQADEYLVFDYSPRAATTFSWLSFVRAIEDRGTKVFADVTSERSIEDLVPLALVGEAAGTIIQDYLAADEELCKPGSIASYSFDGSIPVLVFSFDASAYLLLVPSARVRILWRSLLSHTELSPKEPGYFNHVLARAYPLLAHLSKADPEAELSTSPQLSSTQLKHAGLIRQDTNFIGARALVQ